MQFLTDTEEEVILGALGIVDLTLTASLVVLVIFSGYANFVSRVDTAAHPGWPHWMANIDFSELKLRLMASIVAISAIKLLETYMNIENETDRQLGGKRACSACSSRPRCCWPLRTGSPISPRSVRRLAR